MKIAKPSLLTACVSIIWGCIVALDFATGSAKIAFICIAILAAGAVGFLAGRAGGQRLVPRTEAQNNKSSAIRPHGAFVLASRNAAVGALVQWGRDDTTAQSVGRHLTTLGVFDSDGCYAQGVEALTVDRVLQIFDEYLEEGVGYAENIDSSAPLATQVSHSGQVANVSSTGVIVALNGIEPDRAHVTTKVREFRPEVAVGLAA